MVRSDTLRQFERSILLSPEQAFPRVDSETSVSSQHELRSSICRWGAAAASARRPESLRCQHLRRDNPRRNSPHTLLTVYKARSLTVLWSGERSTTESNSGQAITRNHFFCTRRTRISSRMSKNLNIKIIIFLEMQSKPVLSSSISSSSSSSSSSSLPPASSSDAFGCWKKLPSWGSFHIARLPLRVRREADLRVMIMGLWDEGGVTGLSSSSPSVFFACLGGVIHVACCGSSPSESESCSSELGESDSDWPPSTEPSSDESSEDSDSSGILTCGSSK
eukprot:Lithocolla_globosa_v1_NODE_4655_length_1393_cov_4.132287.p2 type:complete len:278 gc:universal NODE_4655_length_1393_cov_4.132287:1102-269(-)